MSMKEMLTASDRESKYKVSFVGSSKMRCLHNNGWWLISLELDFFGDANHGKIFFNFNQGKIRMTLSGRRRLVVDLLDIVSA